MMHAYSNLYVEDAINNLSEMFDIAINDCGWDADEFAMLFVQSGVAELFESGNPRYVSGMSGYDLVEEVFAYLLCPPEIPQNEIGLERTPEYWAGYYLAEYQWYSGRGFMEIFSRVPLSEIILMYHPYHEMGVDHFIDEMEARISERIEADNVSALKLARERRGYSQSELARAAEVNIRNIQLYEQGVNDIRKAQAEIVLRLAKVLCCDMEALLR